MPVPVVRIRHMGVHVAQRLMRVCMAVLPLRHHRMAVVVVPVIVAVGVLVRASQDTACFSS